MPYCIICGVRFKGRGKHCGLHNNYHLTIRHHDHYNHNHNSDSTDPSSIRFRTGGRHQPRTLRFATDSHDTYGGQYNDTSALVPYSPNPLPTTNLSAALAQPLVQTFATLSHAHAISSLTYSVAPNGSQSLKAEANFEREQCTVCRKWFPDHQKLETHQWEFSIGCEEHGVCLRREDVLWHGTRVRHERCFIRGCGSVYRLEGGWKWVAAEVHVRKWHC
ncbi:hypothetical protein EJ02DRAFT_152667 [Clathrospora elynae]|uniref:Uncharacterized protein n=1 Tax=Clathrospora elynae TaxID=706981 RepID=A0A6A5SQX5_9PLEO|nr:hypothetical protein EJ02DRAFT_152667 [Clathrospora elynae]